MKNSILILLTIAGLYMTVSVLGDEPQIPVTTDLDCSLEPETYYFTIDRGDGEMINNYDQIELKILADGHSWTLKNFNKMNSCKPKSEKKPKFEAHGNISGVGGHCEFPTLSGETIPIHGVDKHLMLILGNDPDIAKWAEIFIFVAPSGGGHTLPNSSAKSNNAEKSAHIYHNGQSHGTKD